jgi:muramoyltetrapeptide carboxypeptidase LdcA involved in peptidoglycan recycling
MIWLVNLSKPFTYSQTATYQSDIWFLVKHNIPYVDFMYEELTHQWKLEAFHNAVRNPEIDTIWFISWWIDLATYLHEIDWELVKAHPKRYIWLSDFTHFAMLAIPLWITCYYGLQLVKIESWYPDADDQKRIVDFLTTNNPVYQREYPIVWGHILIATLLMANTKIDLSNKILFIEHHYIPWETFVELDYWIYALLYIMHTNKPREIVLWKTFLYNPDGTLMDIEVVNNHIIERLQHLGVPITYVDHTKNIIRMW